MMLSERQGLGEASQDIVPRMLRSAQAVRG
jgi:hypothetical protein